MSKKIKMEKRYRDNDGPVRVLCTDAGGKFPVVCIDSHGGVYRYTEDGLFNSIISRGNDLIEIKPKKKKIVRWAKVDRKSGAVVKVYSSVLASLADCVTPDEAIIELTGKYTPEADDGKD